MHDMTTIFFIVLFVFFSFFFFFEWSTLGNVACHRWPFSLKHLFSYEDCFERLVFWSEVVYIISVRREDYGSKVLSRNWYFWSTCPKASIKVISEYHNLRDLCFWSSKRFWQAWSCSKSWCIPNYQLLVPTKIYIFVCLISKN